MIQKTTKHYQRIWEELYRRIRTVLNRHGKSWNFRTDRGDYWIIDEPYGFDQHKVYFNSFKMFDPAVIKDLQGLLRQFSGWEIVVTTYIKPEGESWPEMGLIVREKEIVDDLQRQYFPSKYQSIQYEGSRPIADGE